MGFLTVTREGFWEPKLSPQPQPWFQRMFCHVLGHDWIAKEWAKTGFVIFTPGFYPVHELARLCTCNRCHTKTWLRGQYHGPAMERFYRRYHAADYPFDERGWWPLLPDGSRAPLADRPNCTGW